MHATRRTTIALGDLITTAFDTAAEERTDPEEISKIAVATLRNILREREVHGPGVRWTRARRD